jgi:hypothetical protein
VCLLCYQVAANKLYKPLVGGALASPKLLTLGNAQTSLALRSLARRFGGFVGNVKAFDGGQIVLPRKFGR